MKQHGNLRVSDEGEVMSGFIPLKGVLTGLSKRVTLSRTEVCFIGGPSTWYPGTFLQQVDRLTRRSGTRVEAYKEADGTTVFAFLDPEVPKPRIWRSKVDRLYYCNYDLCEGRGTTKRGAWEAMWKKRLKQKH